MFQLYRDNIEDLLASKNAAPLKKKGGGGGGGGGGGEDMDIKPANLKITLAEHSPTGLVMVEGSEVLPN